MAPVSGTAGSVLVVMGGTSAWGQVKEWTLNIAHNVVEVTAMGMSWKQYIAGIREFDGSVTLVGDPADIVQGSVRTAILNGSAPFVFNYYAGTNFYSGSCLVKKFSPKLSYDGALEISADTQGSGPLSYTGG